MSEYIIKSKTGYFIKFENNQTWMTSDPIEATKFDWVKGNYVLYQMGQIGYSGELIEIRSNEMVTIKWLPHKPKEPKWIEGGTSTDVSALKSLFGDFPIVLNVKNLDVLKGMSAIYQFKPNIYHTIIALIKQYDAIELFAEY